MSLLILLGAVIVVLVFFGIPRSLKRESVIPVDQSNFSLTPTSLQKSRAYLLITCEKLVGCFQPLIHLRQQQDFSVAIRSIENIDRELEGRDLQEKIRNCIRKQQVQSARPLYVLLGGDDVIIPIRYCQAKPRATSDIKAWVPSDLYYSDTSLGTWDADQDGRYGELGDDDSQVCLVPSVCLGRIPVREAEEATGYVNKVLCYENQAQARQGHSFLFLGGPAYMGDTYRRIVLPGCPDSRAVFLGEKPSTSIAKEFEALTPDNAVRLLNNGYDMVTYSGEGSEQAWGWSNGAFGIAEAWALTNMQCLSVVRSGGCKTAWFDGANDPCLAEAWLRNSRGGAVIYAGFARVLCHGPVAGGGQYQDEYYRKLFRTPGISVGQAFMEMKQSMAKRSETSRWHQHGYMLLGDPAIVPVRFPR
ncbi:MAG TPA: C25 family cysteine peptidase [Candidatus Paceibacterota bacterium]|nr:C25 family cysteine peptidase [Verrucomicrobiota bacterium]HRY49577.1 C25 family cysteine peptidase [Candidatus Paceibacterota bacterium]